MLYLISNSFNFVLVSKGCFNKHGCNFDDVSKLGYSPGLLSGYYFRPILKY